ncbi:MAG: 7-cyano-7-deazaguanine synthase QueC [Verrucomicrobia bacterium]|nr:7-cyano-7-deazaguanine synthase QueC [Verrucomicrobiota bacterium]MDA1006190.1 7-cyano-7-deazaguanine synthase QueC [Verrucomicrobiota bacterium]
MSERKQVVVLISGGMDSVAALYHADQHCDVVAGLSFDYGSKHNHKEIPFAEHHCRSLGVPHQTIKLDFINQLFKSDLLQSGGEIPEGHYEAANMKATVVPFRNGIMLAVATGLANSHGANGLLIAAHAGDHAVYPDCREKFMTAIGDAMRLGTDPMASGDNPAVELLRPFIAMRKEEIAARGHELGVDFAQTWSCYKGGDIHCGKCSTCVERREAFILAGLLDPTEYLETGPLPAKPTAAA